MPSTNPPNFAGTFILEAEDLLRQVEEILLNLNGQPDEEAVNHLFRAFHTIKGAGSMFGFNKVAAFTHHLETALDQVRELKLSFSSDLVKVVLSAADHIASLLAAEQNGSQVSEEPGTRIIETLSGILRESAPIASAPFSGDPSSRDSAEPTGEQIWQIHFRPHTQLLLNGANPAALLAELQGLGACTFTAHTFDVPSLEKINPQNCYISWDIQITTAAGKNALRDVFIFVEDLCELSIEPSSRETHPSIELKPEAEPVAASQQAGSSKYVQRESAVRVPSEKLDHLVNLVGELVINQSRLSEASGRVNLPELNGPIEEIERLVTELRDTVLGVRMMPIGSTFSRFKRLVHDVSAELEKEIELITEGAETELDKSVLDQLGDPLVHLIRNSVDHGIESASERIAKGKSSVGHVYLRASHSGSSVVVTVEDDGRGLDAAAIRAKAIQKQLISPDDNLSEKEVFDLIFQPGFSTAQKVTNLSGRGVGMDVVKRQISALRGTVSLASRPGLGSVVSLTLPLTLAIIEGMLIEAGGDRFIVPMSLVTENVELRHADRAARNGRNLVSVRGELIPYISLREVFDMPGEAPEICRVVIVRHEDQRIGLLVDKVLGSHQTVIQSLGAFYRNIALVSGATIMGDGRVALILSLPGLLKHRGNYKSAAA